MKNLDVGTDDPEISSPSNSPINEFHSCDSSKKIMSFLGCGSGSGPKKVVVMRHGERVDDFFPSWIQQCQTKPEYKAFDSNMPLSLKPLIRVLEEYVDDSPLTQMGNLMAQMIGRGMLINNLTPDSIYCSPSLRCIQTASIVSSIVEANCKLRIEPGLFENNNLYMQGRPSWLTKEDLSEAGFIIDLSYKPFFDEDDVWFHKENYSSYNRRLHATFDNIFNMEAARDLNSTVLISAHASTVDLLAGYFSTPRRNLLSGELGGIGHRVPYCATAVFCRQNDSTVSPYGIWSYSGESALPSITYGNFCSRVDQKFLLRKAFDDTDTNKTQL
uniref:Uncharacterized protein n=1 Tax=Ditylenchus dipsaci TaxID=166011 RepID=A0A915DZ65_9BILA